MGFTGRKPGSGAAAGRSASVIVSPILVSPTSLMAAMRMPPSPGPSAATSTARGASTPTRVTRNSFPVAIMRMRRPFASRPSKTRTSTIAPRRGDVAHHGFQDVGGADALLGARQDGVRGVEADHLLDLPAHLLGLGARQVDLVDDR